MRFAERKQAAQVFCAVDPQSPLESMGPIFQVVLKGQPVFLGCKGCVAEALAQFRKLMATMAPKK